MHTGWIFITVVLILYLAPHAYGMIYIAEAILKEHKRQAKQRADKKKMRENVITAHYSAYEKEQNAKRKASAHQ